ncbi:MAG: guanylate kinase [Bacteroidota bacterium]
MSGKAIIFSAPSGAGKTTIVKHLVAKIPSLRFSISATTREARSNEADGVDYYFLTPEEFKKRVAQNMVLEWEEVYQGTFYGSLRSEVDRIWSEGNHVIFDVDVKGGMNLKEKLGDQALAIFVKVENVEVLSERLRKRNTESEESLLKRVDKAVLEMKEERHFEEVLLNHDLDTVLKKAEHLVTDFLS